MRRTNLISLLFISCIIFILAACSSESENKEDSKELHFLFNFVSQTIDPNLDYTPLRAGVTETLVKFNDEDLTIEPWLADKWESADGQNWLFHIRENVTFQNGKPLTAEAVKASLERAMEVNPGVEQVLNIDHMEAKGQDLTIVTKQPFPQFPSELVHPNASIIEVTAQDPEKKPIGTGPFKVESFIAGSSLEVKRYNDYWDGAAKLERAFFEFNEDENARLSALKSGGADIVYRPPMSSLADLEKDENYQVESVVGVRTHELIYNTEHEIFKNEPVRKAFDALVNREELMNNIMLGQAKIAEGPFLPNFAFTPDYPSKDTGQEAALEWFRKAGYDVNNGKVTKDGKNIDLKLVIYNSRVEFTVFAQVLQSQAKEIGINISIEVLENYEDYLINQDNWDLGMYSPLISPRGDASYFLNVSFKSNGSLNFSKVNDPELTAIIEELDRTIEASERTELIKQALLYIDNKTYYSYLVHPNVVVAYNKRISNWNTSKSEYYMLTNKLDVQGK